ncbi:hypothetical protein A167_01548 [Alcanivorax sp. S71-1-4]|uniref:hypothetical protein n=1 Tax=Alcanivorax sp. S71-1-4 TaxID=1177159 RepID=UPI00135B11B6|nr:hypothetical protein [Alcanivorax sp. S71-1-4]KAF0809732.1 hypothetical protein A167_01548 [Alcanivorax sp. S71-1-4]
MKIWTMLALLMLAGCSGRPLVPDEVAALRDIQGEQVHYEDVRLHDGMFRRTAKVRKALREEGNELTALLAQAALTDGRGQPMTERQAVQQFVARPDAVTLGDHIYYQRDMYRKNFARGQHGDVPVWDLALLAHEVTHVWQHQNRSRTGYSLAAVILEHLRHDAPYAFRLVPGKTFLEYRFEQQGAMVQRYVICSYFPATPWFEQLRAVVEPVFGAAPTVPAGVRIARPANVSCDG